MQSKPRLISDYHKHIGQWRTKLLDARNSGVQLIKVDMVGQWAVYLFVDDTTFQAEKAEDMNRILAAYTVSQFTSKSPQQITRLIC